MPVYTELRRLAVIAAIAERLRDQGVPLPAWMRDYQVTPCPVAPTTPSLTVEASRTQTHGDVRRTQTKRIYGGVNLSPADHTTHVTLAAPEAEALALAVAQAIAAAPPVAAVALEHDSKRYQAVTLPGNDTRDVGANRLTATDLIVPVQQGTALRLVRHFHSFFQPSGALGQAWTLDLPRLDTQRRPVRRTQDTTEFTMSYDLTSPLHSVSGAFTRRQFVPEVQAELLVPERAGNMLGVAHVHEPQLGMPTRLVLFRDGQRWHFDAAGDVVAMEQAPLRVVYRRDQARQVRRIEGWYGPQLRADIQLESNDRGLLVSARGSNGAVVQYTYNAQALLTRVEGPDGVLAYQYQDGLVTAVAHNGEMTRQFVYAERGRLQREQHADGSDIIYQVQSEPDGVQVTTAGTGQAPETVLYDTARRPVYAVRADGTHMQWRHAQDGAVMAAMLAPNGEETRVQRSADGRQDTWRLPGGGSYTLAYDAAGRLAQVHEGERQVMHQEWHGDGRLVRVAYGTTVLHPQYREDGVLTGVVVTPPGPGPSFNRWLKVTYDEQGRVAAMTDFAGSATRLSYDQSGGPAVVVSQDDHLEVQRDPAGRVLTIQTSWGDRHHYTYDHQTGELTQVTVTRGGQQAVLTFNQGKLSALQQFDGGHVTMAYYDDGPHAGQIKHVHTLNDLSVTYEYDRANRVAAVNYGDASRSEYPYDAQGRLVGLRQVPRKQ